MHIHAPTDIRTQTEIRVVVADKGDCSADNEIKVEIRSHPASYHKVKDKWERELRSSSGTKPSKILV